MKTSIFALSIAFLMVFSLSAQVSVSTTESNQRPTPEEKVRMEKERERQQQQAQQTVAANPNAPDIVFDKLVHNYGDIIQNDDGRCEFTFKNDGKEPLILSNVRSSCGCTVPEWPRQPILPGESEVIKVKYDTKRIGPINKNVQVYSNAKTSPVILKIEGRVLAPGQSQMPTKEVESSGTPVNR
ncbi:MAG: DUF1573 domain-containing protein [Bacteroidales bacterium]